MNEKNTNRTKNTPSKLRHPKVKTTYKNPITKEFVTEKEADFYFKGKRNSD